MDMKLQQLKHFSLVVQEGGFRAASAKANRSQAALSTSVKELEKTLGQPLFESGHKAKLTPLWRGLPAESRSVSSPISGAG